MFEKIKQQIEDSLLTKNISNLDEYIYELHEALPNYIVNIPAQESEEFYEFAGKFMQYLIDEDSKLLKDIGEDLCDVFRSCYVEICYVNTALSSMSGEDITDDVIKIASYHSMRNSDDIETLLDSIFTFTNHDWANMVGLTLDWDKVVSEVLSESNETDDPNFGVDALFSFLCVDGPDSAEQALQLIYNECGWIGHPEDDIKAGVNFPNYGIINQEEADWYNANMSAIFDYYDGDPCEYALMQIDPANEIYDKSNYNISSAEVAIKIVEALKNNELQVIGNSNGKAIVSFDDVCDALDIDIDSDYYTDSTADAILSASSDKFAIYDSDVLYQIVNHHDGFTDEDIEQFDEPMSYDEFLLYVSEDDEDNEQEEFRGDLDSEIADEFITHLEDEYPDSEITYDELLDEYNEFGISHLISMFNIAEMLDGIGWTITEIPDYEESFKERFGN